MKNSLKTNINNINYMLFMESKEKVKNNENEEQKSNLESESSTINRK